eukprot:TRINITY_DN61321_c0_g1_i1.p3 TRINITY_DN61321_c0_g1~~TRINITY_DN61321_c0_g1_i1.p3  ORF type:complete len:142 (-),score=10.90 TRINITY_DN61321_c0_g1_i1:98-523(-)
MLTTSVVGIQQVNIVVVLGVCLCVGFCSSKILYHKKAKYDMKNKYVQTQKGIPASKIKIPSNPCLECRGLGKIRCTVCDGMGWLNQGVMLKKGEWPQWCRSCRGSGRCYCYDCYGTGIQREPLGFRLPEPEKQQQSQSRKT